MIKQLPKGWIEAWALSLALILKETFSQSPHGENMQLAPFRRKKGHIIHWING